MMKKILLLTSFILSCVLLTSCDGFINVLNLKGPKGDPGQNGMNGIDGKDGLNGIDGTDGSSLITGNDIPTNDIGSIDDCYINLSTWDFYVKTENGWVFNGNIKGQNGIDGNSGVSVTNSYVDENGDLIVVFSSGEEINAGHIKNVSTHTVNFYCDDLLVNTQIVNNGEKVENPVLEDFIVSHWYIDKEFEHEWLLYGCIVTEDMDLYGDYVPVERNINFNNVSFNEVDEYGYQAVTVDSKEICVSKAISTEDSLAVLEDRGILFNKTEYGVISEVSVSISEENFSSAILFYGNTPLSFDHSIALSAGLNVINLDYNEYFTIQNTSEVSIKIDSLSVTYGKKAKIVDDSLPSVIINTKNEQAVTSRLEYVDCTISTTGADEDATNLKAKIKVRGNSTASLAKKPYRIKLDKKNSLFGYQKAKNYVLLADYMDGSNMHNYTALSFAKLVRGDSSFGVKPLHVNVILNGIDMGLFLFGEHIDDKEGRLNISQDNLWEKSFDEINFYIERDQSTEQDSSEIEGETYFKVNLTDYVFDEYVFALKYPEKEDFEEELESGEIDYHEEEFNNYFSSLQEYITDICVKFRDYYNDSTKFNELTNIVDLESLATYGVVDQAFAESDHALKSFKMHRKDGGLLEFGPNWDYDSCSYALPFKNTYVLNPFEVGSSEFISLWFGEKWSYKLYTDTTNGRGLFKSVWKDISQDDLNQFIGFQLDELRSISFDSVKDCSKWMNNQYYALFDNTQYYSKWVSTQLPFLKNYYTNL